MHRILAHYCRFIAKRTLTLAEFYCSLRWRCWVTMSPDQYQGEYPGHKLRSRDLLNKKPFSSKTLQSSVLQLLERQASSVTFGIQQRRIWHQSASLFHVSLVCLTVLNQGCGSILRGITRLSVLTRRRGEILLVENCVTKTVFAVQHNAFLLHLGSVLFI